MLMMCGDEKDEPDAGGAQKKKGYHRLGLAQFLGEVIGQWSGRSWIDDSLCLRSAVVAL